MNGMKQKFIGGVDFEELKSQRVQVYKILQLDLATARTDEEFVITGNYVYAITATDVDTTASLRFNEQFRSLVPLYLGRGVKAPFYRVFITNTAQAGKTIDLAFGVESETFEVFDVGKALSITGGISFVTENKKILRDDSWHYETTQAQAFIAGRYDAASASNYLNYQLFNPAASGVLLYCTQATHINQDSSAHSAELRSHNAAITSLLSNHSGNKYINGAAHAAEFRSQAHTAAIGTVVLGAICLQAGETKGWDFNPAIIIPEGWGLILRCAAVNTPWGANFEWVEK